jgi:hypothetical protein
MNYREREIIQKFSIHMNINNVCIYRFSLKTANMIK